MWETAKNKKKTKRLQTLTPGTGQTEQLLLKRGGRAGAGASLRMARRWLGSAGLAAAPTSHGLALQRHHHVPAQLLSQRAAVLDVVQSVHLPLVFDTWGEVGGGAETHTYEGQTLHTDPGMFKSLFLH